MAKMKILDYCALGVIGISTFFLVLMAYWLYFPVDQEFSASKGFIESKDNHFVVNREYCVRTTGVYSISRELVNVDPMGGEGTLSVSLTETQKVYARGCLNVRRPIFIPPGTPSGQYVLHSTVTWKANPLRDGMAELPRLIVTVK